MLHQLRQTRYLTLAALMLVVAIICVAAGSWQIKRLVEKHDANDRLRSNAHLATASVGDVLTPLPAAGALHQGEQTQYRHVTATGTYDAAHQLLVREQTVNGAVGYLVLTPLNTDGPGTPTLLVVRGFVAADGDNTPVIAAPPTGTVVVTGRIQPTQNRADRYGGDGVGQIRVINVASAASRLGGSVYGAYIELLAGQPGTNGLTVIPDPDLSNPAGGAIEPQHLAYVIQWYLFALLALAAPVVMARVDSKRVDEEPVRRPSARKSVREALHDAAPAAPLEAEDQARAAKLADRYGSARRQ